MKNRLKLCILLVAVLLCGCGDAVIAPINEGETYLEGTWYFSDGGLNVGYNLFADGGGYQFIGMTSNPIRYGIYGGQFYVALLGEEATAFDFEQTDEGLRIGGLLYLPVQDDPETASSIAALIEAQSSEGEKESGAETFGFYLSLILTGVLIGLIVIWFARTQKKRGNRL